MQTMRTSMRRSGERTVAIMESGWISTAQAGAGECAGKLDEETVADGFDLSARHAAQTRSAAGWVLVEKVERERLVLLRQRAVAPCR